MGKESAFEVGDIVRLKSGGPEMTIKETRNDVDYTSVMCQWFAGAKLESGWFKSESLESAEDE